MTHMIRNSAEGAPTAKAAPTGGADVFGRLCRGCFIDTPIAILICSALAGPVASAGQPFLPSGLEVTFHDEISEPTVYRVRYVVPALQDAEVDYMTVSDDMARLCVEDALPRLAETGATPDRVIVTLMAQPVEFGYANADVRQFFESYSVQDGRCIWEAF